MPLEGTPAEPAEAGEESDWEYEYHDTEMEVLGHHSSSIDSVLTNPCTSEVVLRDTRPLVNHWSNQTREEAESAARQRSNASDSRNTCSVRTISRRHTRYRASCLHAPTPWKESGASR